MASQAMTALAVIPPTSSSSVVEHSAEEWNALKETVAKGTSAAQFRVFIGTCHALGLDPFKKQIYCWADNNQQGGLTIYTSVAGLRALAKDTGHYRGQRGPLWCGADGVWTDEWISATPPVAAKFGVVSDEWDDVIWAVARMESYRKTGGQWVKAPEHMLAKVVESLALRRAFPGATSGVYSDAELGGPSVEVEGEADTPAKPMAVTPMAVPVAPDRAVAQHQQHWATHDRLRHEQREGEREDQHEHTAAAPSTPSTPSTEAEDAWVTLHGRIRAVGLTTKREADALCRSATGKPWEQCRTQADYDAIDARVAELELARDAAQAELATEGEAELSEAPA